MQIPQSLRKILAYLYEHHAQGIIVGGAVRDTLLGREIKDFDIEVYGIGKIDLLEKMLSRFGRVDLVGKSFGILKVTVEGSTYDFSFPRKESKVAPGHKGFEVSIDGKMDFEQAAKRRDFTINAMGYDPISERLYDPFGGREDLKRGILRHIDSVRFAEDPLRVYRAVQFSARFGLDVAEETAALCKEMVAEGMLDELPKERIYEEWKKLLLKSPRPSIGLELMREWGITKRHFPELHALIDVPQDPKWHPEGDVWVHTMMVVDTMAAIGNREQVVGSKEQGVGSREEKERLKLLFAALCHDFGKPLTTTIEYKDGTVQKWNEINKSVSTSKIRAIGHEKAGLEPTQSFMYRLSNEHDFIESILPLVEHHLKPSQFYAQRAKAGAIRRLALRVNIKELVEVAKADFLGRTTLEAKVGEYEAGEWLLAEAQKLQVEESSMPPLLQGRDLIALGLKPSRQFGEILSEVYEAQMDGQISNKNEAIQFVLEKIEKNGVKSTDNRA